MYMTQTRINTARERTTNTPTNETGHQQNAMAKTSDRPPLSCTVDEKHACILEVGRGREREGGGSTTS